MPHTRALALVAATCGSLGSFVSPVSAQCADAKLLVPGATDLDSFGASVAVSGDRALLGDPAHGGKGAAYVFDGGPAAMTWSATLLASDGARSDLFGHAVDLDGDVAVIGAFYDDDGGESSGSAYVFERSASGWAQTAKLTASDPTPNAQFGRAVTVEGDIVAVGAPVSDAVYVFARGAGGWTQEARLTPSDASAASFGDSIDLSGAPPGGSSGDARRWPLFGGHRVPLREHGRGLGRGATLRAAGAASKRALRPQRRVGAGRGSHCGVLLLRSDLASRAGNGARLRGKRFRVGADRGTLRERWRNSGRG